jgi:hypothetical protein
MGLIWKELVNIGIYKRGADVSEVGTTWISSLISMNTLRAFTRAEIAQIGGERVFLPTSWQTTSLVGDSRVLAIPFLSDVRVIFTGVTCWKKRCGRRHGFLLLRGDGRNAEPAERDRPRTMGIIDGYLYA